MQAFYRMHNIKTLPTLRWGVRLFKKFLSALVDTASKNLDPTTLAQSTPAPLMRKAATVKNRQVSPSGKAPIELAMGRKPRDLMDRASINPELLIYTSIKQDLLNEEIKKLAMQTHLELQQCLSGHLCIGLSGACGTAPFGRLLWATHGLPFYQAPVYRGCPPMPRQDGIGSRASTLVVVRCWW